MTNLSQSAQAVLDAFTADDYGVWLEGDPDRLAAALRAAALYCKRDSAILLNLADELEGAQ